MPTRIDRLLALAAAALLPSAPALAADPCLAVEGALRGELADVVCFWTPDLTTSSATTTPADNAVPGVPPGTWPPFAFTPRTDRGVISPNPPDRTPIVSAVPGIQLEARIADDPTHEARFLLRLPDDWNGRLVVAGASGTRSEFNGDFAWSDYVVQQGYAYASQNKGIMNLRLVAVSPTPPPADPLACRLNPLSPVWVHFYDNDPEKPFTEWQARIVEAARLARDGAKARHGRHPRFTYAVGTSNGGYQVRRALEEAPDLFDGGVDWEGTYVSPEDNILVQLPTAIRWFPEYARSGFDASSGAAQAMRAAGYPPDIVNRDASGTVTASLWQNHYLQFWEVTQCQWQKRLDPGYDTYGPPPLFAAAGTYDYRERVGASDVAANVAAFATTGKIKRPLVTVAGTMDSLLTIDHQARAYAAAVAASRKGNPDRRAPQYRLYEVQNGNHIETYRETFPQLEYIQPYAQRAFDLLVDHVEKGAPLPPDQCIPRGSAGEIAAEPSRPGRCADLLAP
jgi:hypothetical protein